MIPLAFQRVGEHGVLGTDEPHRFQAGESRERVGRLPRARHHRSWEDPPAAHHHRRRPRPMREGD